MARDNRTLGRFILDGIPPAPRGMPQVEVSFDIDANGILSVSARDKATGKRQEIVIKASSGLSESEIKKMMDESKNFEEDDRKKREIAEIRNRTDNQIYQSRKTIQQYKDKLSSDVVDGLERAITAAEEAMKGEDLEAIKAAGEALNEAAHKAAENIYRETAGQQPGPGAAEAEGEAQEKKGDGKKGNVIDADFEEV